MNGFQSIPSASVTAFGVNAMTGSSAQGSSEATPTISFAALMAGMLIGNGKGNSEEGSALFNLLATAPSTSDANRMIGTVEGEASEEALALEAMLAQLSTWFVALPQELQQQVAQHPQVKEWEALANAELLMAQAGNGSELLATAVLPEGLEVDSEVAASKLVGLLERLTSFVVANPEYAPMVDVTRQASTAFQQAFTSAIVRSTEAATSIVSETVAEEAMSKTSSQSLLTKAVRTELDNLLAKMNGQATTTTAQKVEAFGPSPWSHLSALQAKSTYVHLTTVEAASVKLAQDAGVVVNDNLAKTVENELQHLQNMDATKATSTEQASKEVSAQRVPLSNASEQLNNWILKNATGAAGHLKAETIIKLMPEHLGQVEVRLVMQNGQLTATITTESLLAKEALESNLAALRHNLQSQGVTVEKLVVSQNNGFTSGMFQDGKQRQSSGRDSERDQRSRNEEASDDWSNVLSITGEEDTAQLSRTDGGSFQAKV